MCMYPQQNSPKGAQSPEATLQTNSSLKLSRWLHAYGELLRYDNVSLILCDLLFLWLLLLLLIEMCSMFNQCSLALKHEGLQMSPASTVCLPRHL